MKHTSDHIQQILKKPKPLSSEDKKALYQEAHRLLNNIDAILRETFERCAERQRQIDYDRAMDVVR